MDTDKKDNLIEVKMLDNSIMEVICLPENIDLDIILEDQKSRGFLISLLETGNEKLNYILIHNDLLNLYKEDENVRFFNRNICTSWGHNSYLPDYYQNGICLSIKNNNRSDRLIIKSGRAICEGSMTKERIIEEIKRFINYLKEYNKRRKIVVTGYKF